MIVDLQWACTTLAAIKRALRMCMVSIGSCSTIQTYMLVLPLVPYYNLVTSSETNVDKVLEIRCYIGLAIMAMFKQPMDGSSEGYCAP
jgi:hypothetical protein